MLHRVTKIDGCRVLATDGEIGRVHDVYFDDEHWVVRYLVVDTGGWLSGRKVLISPYAVRLVDPAARAVAVNLDRERVERSPNIDTDQPVSRQHEADFYSYYGYPAYWPYPTYWAGGAMPVLTPLSAADRVDLEAHRRATQLEKRDSADSHLRSAAEVAGYHIHATDGGVGHVEDFLFDDETWLIRHLVVDTRNWLPGKHVLVSPQWIREVDWSQNTVKVGRSREQIKQSPKFDPEHLPAVDYGQDSPQPVGRP